MEMETEMNRLYDLIMSKQEQKNTRDIPSLEWISKETWRLIDRRTALWKNTKARGQDPILILTEYRGSVE